MSDTTTKKIQCRYFILGFCSKRDQCQFSHSLLDTQSEICKFYQIGSCKYKDKCMYKHSYLPKYKPIKCNIENIDKNVSSSQATATATTIKPKYKKFEKLTKKLPRGTELFSEEDLNSISDTILHGLTVEPDKKKTIMCVYCGEIFDEFTNNLTYQKHMEECQKKELRKKLIERFKKLSLEKTCAICIEKVLQKDKPSDRNFGLLENCNHTFCLHCIRDWRKNQDIPKNNIRACPICRSPSFYIIPSYYIPPTQSEKKIVIDNYMLALKDKHCAYFNHGKSNCPYSTSCFYKHEFPDGTLADKEKLVMNADGILEIYSPYLDEKNSQLLTNQLLTSFSSPNSQSNHASSNV